MTQDIARTLRNTTASSWDDEELSSLLNPGNVEIEPNLDPLGPEPDCFPLDGVMTVAGASAQARSETDRTRSANLARAVLARAEHEVRDLLAQDLLAADHRDRSADIVARAQREVTEILARGRGESSRADGDPLTELTEQAAHDVPGSADAPLDEKQITAPSDACFASLRALALPAEESGMRYQVTGRLTLATLLALQQAVSRLPGVNSARVDPHPDDLAVLSMTTDDSSLVHGLLVSMPGIHLQMDAA